MSLSRLMALGLAASVGSQAPAQCGVSTASCLEPHPGLGCVVVECCELVCKANPLCCELEWDIACATYAQQSCGGLVCPSVGSCLEIRAQPGCDDTDCCKLVCRVDSYCCFSAWDALCVQAADRLCGVPICSIVVPPNAIDESEPCYQRLNDGCNRPDDVVLPLVCGEVRTGKWVSGAPRDTDWYEFALATPTRVTLELVAEFPSQFLLLRGPCEGPFEVLAEANGQPCSSATIELALDPGVYRCLVAAGIPDRVFRNAFPCDEIDPKNPPDPGVPPPPPAPWNRRYVLTASCVGTLVGDLDGDGIVGPADLAILLGAWGQPGPGDLNGDGVVGSADLAILLGAWTA